MLELVLFLLVECSCNARLGSYNWAGSQSESGAWVTPAFQLHHSKVDAMSAQAAAPLNIRRPLVGPGAVVTSNANDISTAQAHLQAQPESKLGHQHQSSNSKTDQAFVPVDSTQTLVEVGHTAAKIASESERPGLVPKHASRR